MIVIMIMAACSSVAINFDDSVVKMPDKVLYAQGYSKLQRLTYLTDIQNKFAVEQAATIKAYRKLAEHDQAKGKNNDADLEWIDISKSKVELKAEGIKYADAMKLIHIKDASGVHQVGISAVLTIWDQIPYYRKLSKLLRAIPVIHPFLDKLYRLVADWRLKLNGGR